MGTGGEFQGYRLGCFATGRWRVWLNSSSQRCRNRWGRGPVGRAGLIWPACFRIADRKVLVTFCSVPYLWWFITPFFLPFSGWQKYVFGNLIFLQTNWVGFCSSIRRPRRRPPRRAGVIPSCPATRPSVKKRPMLWSLCSRTLMRWLRKLPSWATRWSWERDEVGEVGRGCEPAEVAFVLQV